MAFHEDSILEAEGLQIAAVMQVERDGVESEVGFGLGVGNRGGLEAGMDIIKDILSDPHSAAAAVIESLSAHGYDGLEGFDFGSENLNVDGVFATPLPDVPLRLDVGAEGEEVFIMVGGSGTLDTLFALFDVFADEAEGDIMSNFVAGAVKDGFGDDLDDIYRIARENIVSNEETLRAYAEHIGRSPEEVRQMLTMEGDISIAEESKQWLEGECPGCENCEPEVKVSASADLDWD